jgi:hypothetical protein
MDRREQNTGRDAGGWFVTPPDRVKVVRVRPGLTIGETESGELSYDRAHAQLELGIENGSLLIRALGDFQLELGDGTDGRTKSLTFNQSVAISLPHNNLRINTQIGRRFTPSGRPVEVDMVYSPSDEAVTEAPPDSINRAMQAEGAITRSQGAGVRSGASPENTRPNLADLSRPENLSARSMMPRKALGALAVAVFALVLGVVVYYSSTSTMPAVEIDEALLTQGAEVTEPSGTRPGQLGAERPDSRMPSVSTVAPSVETTDEAGGVTPDVGGVVRSPEEIPLIDGARAAQTQNARVAVESPSQELAASETSPLGELPSAPDEASDVVADAGDRVRSAQETGVADAAREEEGQKALDDLAVELPVQELATSATNRFAELPSVPDEASDLALDPDATSSTDEIQPTVTDTEESLEVPADVATVSPQEVAASETEFPSARLEQIPVPQASNETSVERVETEQDRGQPIDLQRDLLAADEALAEGRLISPEDTSALALYSRVLSYDPESQGALKGIASVRQQLINRAFAELAAGEWDLVPATLDAAEKAGATGGIVADLRGEASYQMRLARAQAGQFDDLYPSQQLDAIEQEMPRLSRWRSAGYREVEIEFTVTVGGTVSDLQILGNPPPRLADTIGRAVETWRFEPVLERGRPMPVRTRVLIEVGS